MRSLLITLSVLAGCGPADERMEVVNQSFNLSSRGTSSVPFLVYSDGMAFVDVDVFVSQGEADVTLFREETWPVENFMAVRITKKTSFAGNLQGGAYTLAVANNGKGSCAVQVIVGKNLVERK